MSRTRIQLDLVGIHRIDRKTKIFIGHECEQTWREKKWIRIIINAFKKKRYFVREEDTLIKTNVKVKYISMRVHKTKQEKKHVGNQLMVKHSVNKCVVLI